MTPTLLPQIGRAIASIGSGHFSSMFHELINSQLTVDATHLYLLPRPWQTPKAPVSTVFNETVTSHRAASRFTDSIQLNPAQESPSYCCKITAFRGRPSSDFSMTERRRLEDISPLLFSILEKHVDALQLATLDAESRKPEGLEDRFHERLRETGLVLSERELQVCVGLLTGQTAMEQAERLALKVSTVSSYQRRAAVKLGISGRNSLMRWMYASPNDISSGDRARTPLFSPAPALR
ncbi:helix-turn-helix transcriptional regulator [Pseudomonas alliivorans]|uniref:Helix-turn-helix transcriptional regulator n=1 Tax=Pseudomonas alliivorans TaxID=2810613 RepID=A0ABS4C3M7_9PSED|nr:MULTISPECIES: helix-turn-helix transcriptional regulator [Pseudomonas]MBP0942816.1 helix-turn-helix transcriptional regulator [Pseudomonas alliivorans]MBP0944926.1 helix-turn-helix transcriptional regulator [Pseudomonas alliivorans]MBP0949117.1 helix-turn-helix transcriptional regulator [Pseudomonas alliivorans]MCO5367077.1 helix-turn-helix transcriptional regulator [Pseudomonas alliivorans]MEE4307648.1 helix-turn-helix transcriptional regulator [Pseudomonas alliivorans]